VPRHLAAALLLCSLAAPVHAGSLDFAYDERADERCSARQPVKAQWSSELRSRLPEFRALWESAGPAMVDAVTALTHKPFDPAGTVRLTLCDIPSNAIQGLTVNMRFALQSFTSTPVPLRYKIDTVFHEALHDFVARHTPRESALLALHSSEPTCVRNHLHLLALQKAVLLSVKDERSLDQVIAIDSQLPSGCYKRAWALVNATSSTHTQFVAELSRP
jgi:hypothetical protein